MHSRILVDKDHTNNLYNKLNNELVFADVKENKSNYMLNDSIHGYSKGNNMTKLDYLNCGVDIESNLKLGENRTCNLKPFEYVAVDANQHTLLDHDHTDYLSNKFKTSDHTFNTFYHEPHTNFVNKSVIDNTSYTIGGLQTRISNKTRGEKYFTL